jgi:hypothetical protein
MSSTKASRAARIVSLMFAMPALLGDDEAECQSRKAPGTNRKYDRDILTHARTVHPSLMPTV